MSIAAVLFRAIAVTQDKKRDKGLTTPEDIERFDNIVYGSDKKWNILDVYRPKGSKGKKLPVIVSIHGGGWVYGDKELYQYYCMNLAQRGFAVVNFTYRLAPKNKFPASFEDTNLVFNWIMNNHEKYGLDINNIFAVGDSAGAHNLALYSCILTNPECAKRFSLKTPEGLKFNAIALNCGCYNMEVDGFSTLLLKDYLHNKKDKKERDLLNIDRYINESFPPCYLMTAVDDFLREEPPVLMKAFDKCGVEYKYKKYGDENNKLAHVFHVDIKTEFAKECNDDECNFFKEHMK